MASVLSQFSPDDPELARLPIPSFNGHVKKQLDQQYRVDLIETKEEVDRLYEAEKKAEADRKEGDKEGKDEDE